MKKFSHPIRSLKDWWYLGGVLSLSAVLQLSFITRSSIWHDEAYSLWLSSYGWGEVIARTARDVHPPLYYLGLKLWRTILGDGTLVARSFSTLAVLVTVVAVFLLVRRLFGSHPARLSALLVAIGPFLIRYGQEARMYALVACLLAVATYVLVKAISEHRLKLFYVYGLIMALAFYTHYYSLFMLVIHWLFLLASCTRQGKSQWGALIRDKHWWGANLLIGLLFLPWLPSAYGQFTRVQAGFWIPPVNSGTLPSTFASWLSYVNYSNLGLAVRWLIPVGLAGLAGWTIWKDKLLRRQAWLVASWAFLPPLLVLFISVLGRPVYIDRYLVFAAVGFYTLLGILLYAQPLNRLAKFRPLIILGVVAVLAGGIRNVYLQSDHRMDTLAAVVNQQATNQDALVAGELYVYLDFSYYEQLAQPTKLYAPSGVSGYGESSLFYDQPELLVSSWQEVHPTSNIVWVVGKTGDKDYFNDIPTNWQLEATHRAKDAILHKYTLSD